jgi:hypothetical protein
VINEILVQFGGFRAEGHTRVYSFTVREQDSEPREFTVTIANEVFDARRLRYQDAPDICSLKVRHELAESSNRPLTTHYALTDAELEVYRGAHAPRPSKNPFSRKSSQEQ